MTGDPILSLQDELQQFVLQTQNRLRGLLESTHRLKGESSKNSLQQPAGEGHGCPAASIAQTAVNDEVELTAVASPPQSPTTNSRTSSSNIGFAIDETSLGASADVAGRLESIKRRLADRIGNS